ncbi:MAG: glycosyltransferase [Paracoccaceae bacterium]
MSAPRVAFHAPLKPPDAERPSGDRRIARLTLAALERAGFAPFVASRLRTLDLAGDPAAQAALRDAAEAEAARLVPALAADPPVLWYTYHCYWKAPDLIGPRVARALGIPYAISEPSVSPRRREGPWAGFAAEAEAAIAAADLLLWSTERDRPALAAFLGGEGRMARLAPFLDLGPRPPARAPGTGPLRLIAVGMMRPGDKAESYARLAAALVRVRADWRLEVVGDGTERAAVEAQFAPFGPRVRFRGVLEGAALRAALEAAELLVWPGVGEGIGMLYLEAQAADLACLAEDRPGPRDVVHPWRPLPPPGDAAAFAAGIEAAAADRAALAEAGRAARAAAEAEHSLDAAAALLRDRLGALIGAPAG